MGFIIDSRGIRADPEKVRAISGFPVPSDITGVRSFLGLFNQVSKFVKNFSHETAPIRALLRKDADFLWGPDQNA